MSTAVAVCALVLLVWWTTFDLGLRRMGYLLLDDTNKHGILRSQSRTEKYYTTGAFLMLVLKGLVHGSLELQGSVLLFMHALGTGSNSSRESTILSDGNHLLRTAGSSV